MKILLHKKKYIWGVVKVHINTPTIPLFKYDIDTKPENITSKITWAGILCQSYMTNASRL